jgi:hypothetical protein
MDKEKYDCAKIYYSIIFQIFRIKISYSNYQWIFSSSSLSVLTSVYWYMITNEKKNNLHMKTLI